MIIENLRVFRGNGAFEPGSLCVEGERIVSQTTETTKIDGGGAMVIPGLVDIHLHGCCGVDFGDGTAWSLDTMARYLSANGIAGFTPASMTLSEETIGEIYDTAAGYTSPEDGAAFLGINMEGPFLSEKKKGAQKAAWLRQPDTDMFDRLQKRSGGKVKWVTVAPELPGAMDFIRKVSRGTTVSLGHTACDYKTAMDAFEAGANHVTHLYNAMTPFRHRDPGMVVAAADAPEADVEMICDGIHIHPAVIRDSFKLFDPEHIILISDSMMATGMADGQYALGGQPVTVKGHFATLADGTLAGSATNLMDCVRCAVRFGIPLATAVRCASVNPARALGIEADYGSLAPGRLANLVFLDDHLKITRVILRGKDVTPWQEK
ncbi:MAG: N-acetylglucosamine-6-phosphate deacetylase [Eubacteriaceae bacterium]|nr:N-acetylglucosamine-6-phosphate deacetylase [Eubacteriaceae bacterium]